MNNHPVGTLNAYQVGFNRQMAILIKQAAWGDAFARKAVPMLAKLPGRFGAGAARGAEAMAPKRNALGNTLGPVFNHPGFKYPATFTAGSAGMYGLGEYRDQQRRKAIENLSLLQRLGLGLQLLASPNRFSNTLHL